MGPKPSDLNRPEVRAILDEVRGLEEIGSRIDAISRHFIGFPYLETPLVGSATLPERLTVALGGFDCVTYVESVLALARASTATEFVENLRRIRYAGGDVDWRRRNHYMTAWIRNNQSAGIVRNRLKIASAIQNAKLFLDVQAEFGSFDRYIWQFVGGKTIVNAWPSLQKIPTRTAESDAMSKDLKGRGFSFVGSVICYAFMQAAGLVNDHVVHCFRYSQVGVSNQQSVISK